MEMAALNMTDTRDDWPWSALLNLLVTWLSLKTPGISRISRLHESTAGVICPKERCKQVSLEALLHHPGHCWSGVADGGGRRVFGISISVHVQAESAAKPTAA